MFLRALLVAVALLAFGFTQPLAPSSTIALRACVRAGTHGALVNLSDAAIAGKDLSPAPKTTLFWFDKNIGGFGERVGQLVEIEATVSSVIDEPRDFQARDGVFAEVDPSAARLIPVGTAGSNDPLPEHPLVVQATVTRLRSVGACR
jgi:hypothetical protein